MAPCGSQSPEEGSFLQASTTATHITEMDTQGHSLTEPAPAQPGRQAQLSSDPSKGPPGKGKAIWHVKSFILISHQGKAKDKYLSHYYQLKSRGHIADAFGGGVKGRCPLVPM